MKEKRGVELERDVILLDQTAQKLQPGSVKVKCSDCGELGVLNANQVRDMGRRPAAVVLCFKCTQPKPDLRERVLTEALGAAGALAPDGSALANAILELTEKIQKSEPPKDPRQITSHFDFDPPSAGVEIQKTFEEVDKGLQARWRWTNDMGMPVLISRKTDAPNLPKDIMIMPEDKIELTAMLGSFKPFEPPKRRPIRDNPQA